MMIDISAVATLCFLCWILGLFTRLSFLDHDPQKYNVVRKMPKKYYEQMETRRKHGVIERF